MSSTVTMAAAVMWARARTTNSNVLLHHNMRRLTVLITFTVLASCAELLLPFMQTGDLAITQGYMHELRISTGCSQLPLLGYSNFLVKLSQAVSPWAVAYFSVGPETSSAYAPYPDQTHYLVTTYNSGSQPKPSVIVPNAQDDDIYMSVFCTTPTCHYTVLAMPDNSVVEVETIPVQEIPQGVQYTIQEEYFSDFLMPVSGSGTTLENSDETDPSVPAASYQVVVCTNDMRHNYPDVSKFCLSSVVTATSIGMVTQSWANNDLGQNDPIACYRYEPSTCWEARDHPTDPSMDLTGEVAAQRSVYVSKAVDLDSMPSNLLFNVYTVASLDESKEVSFTASFTYLPYLGDGSSLCT
ncbi:hypothetical protein Pelo_15526 [Pelomyxa schiedti]|nr:hypothetical protein Pelo_15526 [Pelomyxa schiedti]